MNLFDRKGESSEAFFTNKGESSEASFGDTKPRETTNQLPSAPIQDENGNLTFNLEGRTYSLNVNLEEDRKRVKAEVNANSLTKYDWFKEETGEKHWVLYNTEMYEVIVLYHFLCYKEDCNLAPVIPINATSCNRMFSNCPNPPAPDVNYFGTVNVYNMGYIFNSYPSLTSLDFSNFNTSNIIEIGRASCRERV